MSDQTLVFRSSSAGQDARTSNAEQLPKKRIGKHLMAVILNRVVSASGDDIGHESGGNFHTMSPVTGPSLSIGYFTPLQSGWGSALRFTNITITKSDIINSCTLTITTRNARTLNTVRAYIDAELGASGTIPTTDAEWDAKVKTVAKVDWNPVPEMPVVDAQHTTPDLTAVMQEIVNQGGWVNGNAVVFYIDDGDQRSDAVDNTVRFAHMYDSDPTKAAQLNISYTPANVGGSTAEQLPKSSTAGDGVGP